MHHFGGAGDTTRCGFGSDGSGFKTDVQNRTESEPEPHQNDVAPQHWFYFIIMVNIMNYSYFVWFVIILYLIRVQIQNLEIWIGIRQKFRMIADRDPTTVSNTCGSGSTALANKQ
jgi:hypothetical protein